MAINQELDEVLPQSPEEQRFSPESSGESFMLAALDKINIAIEAARVEQPDRATELEGVRALLNDFQNENQKERWVDTAHPEPEDREYIKGLMPDFKYNTQGILRLINDKNSRLYGLGDIESEEVQEERLLFADLRSFLPTVDYEGDEVAAAKRVSDLNSPS